MEAFAAATNAQPQNTEELQRVLDELPRKELQALGKSHGVKATLKRESLVGKLMRVLPAQLWPSATVEEEGINEEMDANSTGGEAVDAKQEEKEENTKVTIEEEKEENTKVTIEEEVSATVAVAAEQAPTPTEPKEPTPTGPTPTEPTPTEKTKTKTKQTAGAKKTTSTVGKKRVATKKQAVGTSGSPKKQSTAGKLSKTTSVKATAATAAKATTVKAKTNTTTTTTTSSRSRVARQVATPSKSSPARALDKIHAKQAAAQPTLQEHESAKKARAAALFVSKVSAVKKTRSQTKKAEAAAAASSVTKTLNFGPPKTPVKTPRKVPMRTPMRTPMKTPTKTPAKKLVEPTEAASGTPNATTKKGGSFTPYKGPVPVFTGESSFTPKKPTVRPAPMAVAVMKAARVTRPKSPTPVKPLRTSAAAADKENTSPTTDRNAQPSKTATLASSPKKKKAVVSQVSSRLMKSTVAAEAKKTFAARTSVKTSTTQLVTLESKKEERRSKFAAQAKAKSAATRRESRASTAITLKQ